MCKHTKSLGLASHDLRVYFCVLWNEERYYGSRVFVFPAWSPLRAHVVDASQARSRGNRSRGTHRTSVCREWFRALCFQGPPLACDDHKESRPGSCQPTLCRLRDLPHKPSPTLLGDRRHFRVRTGPGRRIRTALRLPPFHSIHPSVPCRLLTPGSLEHPLLRLLPFFCQPDPVRRRRG